MRHGLVDLVFEDHRGFATEGAVEPRAVVKDFDPLEDGSVVITVAPAAHARHGSHPRQPLPIVYGTP